jgi:hypothetical protein
MPEDVKSEGINRGNRKLAFFSRKRRYKRKSRAGE